MNTENALIALKENARFYISTPERAGEALLFVRNLKKFAEEIEEKVKARAVEIMDKENMEVLLYSITDPETGEVREWEVRRSYDTVTKEYRPENVIKALGDEGLKYMKVSKGKLETFLKKASAKKEITMEEVELAVSDPIENKRKGAGVILKEVKVQ